MPSSAILGVGVIVFGIGVFAGLAIAWVGFNSKLDKLACELSQAYRELARMNIELSSGSRFAPELAAFRAEQRRMERRSGGPDGRQQIDLRDLPPGS